jgi:curved DNA-binding protein CbpA
MHKDYYLIAQVHPEAETRVIERMRRVLAQIYHPDHTMEEKKEEYTKKMQEINDAIDYLTNESQRRKYNKEHPYFTNRYQNQSFGPHYIYKDDFDKEIHPYLDSDILFNLASKAKEMNKLEPFTRKHLYFIARRIESNKELTDWQKRVIYIFIDDAIEEGLIE